MDDNNRWHRPEVLRHRVWRGYVDHFEGGHAFGLLQENGQNSFDAYAEEILPKDMKIVINYNADDRVLLWRDFNTGGMPHCRQCIWGERPDGHPCTNPDCAWGAYHNMGYSVKVGELAGGSRGMGKSLQLLAGTRTIVRTSLPSGVHAASEWKKEKDWVWRLAPEYETALSSPGTELQTDEVVDDVHEVLSEGDKVVAELQERWFRLIEDGAKIEYLLTKDGVTSRKVIPKPVWPELDESQGRAKAQKEIPQLVITSQGERQGELRNLHLYLARNSFPDDDPRWGIALVKNGKQTITRFTEFPSEIPDVIRRRIYGWCDVICTGDEPFLKDAENSSHTGYRSDHIAYKAVKRQLRELAKGLAEPFIRKGGEKVTEKEASEAREILDVLNEALREVPEFDLFLEEGPPPPRALPEPRDYVYLSQISLERRRYERGTRVPVKAIVKNPTDQEVFVRVFIEHFDPTPVAVSSTEEGLILPPGSPMAPATAEAEWEVPLNQSYASGVHWVQVSLRQTNRTPFEDADGNPIVKRRSVFVEEDPPEHRRRTRGRSDGRGPSGFEGLQFFKKPDLAQSYEAYIDMGQARVFVNLRGKRLENARENSKNRRGYWPVIAELVGEKIMEQILDRQLGEKDDWKAENVKKVVMALEASRVKLIHVMVDRMARSAFKKTI